MTKEPATVDAGERLNRADARAKIFNALDELEKRIVVFRGVELEVRQPSVGDMIELSSKETEGQRRSFILELLLKYVYVPGTDEFIFEETDIDSIKKLPWNKDLTGLVEVFGELSQVDFQGSKAEA